jgi:hypothetical protein
VLLVSCTVVNGLIPPHHNLAARVPKLRRPTTYAEEVTNSERRITTTSPFVNHDGSLSHRVGAVGVAANIADPGATASTSQADTGLLWCVGTRRSARLVLARYLGPRERRTDTHTREADDGSRSGSLVESQG